MAFWNIKKELIGLDIGSWAVKAVRLHREGGHFKLKTLAQVTYERPTLTTPASDEQILTAVHDCLREVGASECGVVCGLGGEQVVVRPFSFGPLPEEEIMGAVRLEAMQVCPFGVKDTSVDYQLLATAVADPPGTKEKEEQGALIGIYSVATNQSVQDTYQLVSQAGGICRLLDVDGLALLNGAQTLQNDQQTLALLHVGHRNTIMAIVEPELVPFVRDISFAGQTMIESVCQEVGQPWDIVEAVLNGSDNQGQARKGYEKALNKACAQLAQKVTETLRFYRSQQGAAQVRTVQLSGGFSLLAGFSQRLDDALGDCHVKAWDPLAVLPHELNKKQAALLTQGPAFAVAVGLALRTL